MRHGPFTMGYLLVLTLLTGTATCRALGYVPTLASGVITLSQWSLSVGATTTTSSNTTASSTSTSTTSTNTVTTSSSTAAGAAPTGNSSSMQDIDTVRERRISSMIGSVTGIDDVASWLSSISADGQWPSSEIDYTTGCDAQRANWPAYVHWNRIVTMAAVYHGGWPNATQWVGDATLQTAMSNAMDWWFSRDFTVDACLDNGGTATCPCGTPGLWNTNWFSNVILVPKLVVQACLICNDTLTPSQDSNCTHMAARAYSPFYDTVQPSYVSGANILDMSTIGIDLAIRVYNVTLLTEAYGRVHSQMVIEPGIKVDGIKPDGSFGQHNGLLYNGNYGKDYSNDVLNLEEAAGETEFAANADSQDAFATLVDGDRWMIYRNVLTNVLHWDFSALPRFITFPVIDGQATAGLNLNLTQVKSVGEEWNSQILIQVAESLTKNTTSTSANAGKLDGNNMFFTNDYMVQRGTGYVTTLKMYSSRTKNTECTNSQNPFGFHLADGTVYTYVHGSEYEDIAAAWDWNLIPGTTVDYGATPLSCDNAGFTGAQKFVGGASTGGIGVAAMRYTNPYTKSLGWQKAWFFLDGDVQHVTVSNITSNTTAPVYSVLDQKRHSGPLYVNDVPSTGKTNASSQVSSLWHDNVGYVFDGPSGLNVSVQTGNKTGNWSAIGTSTQPPESVDLFSAWIEHHNISEPVSYTVFPANDHESFKAKSSSCAVKTIRNDAHVVAVLDEAHHVAAAVFWDAAGGSVTFDHVLSIGGTVTISASGNSVVIYQMDSGNITVSDPSQSLSVLHVALTVGGHLDLPGSHSAHSQNLTFTLPPGPGGLAGSSVSQNL